MKNSIKRFAVVTFTSLAFLMVILTGCSKENSLEPTPEFSSSIQASDDVAELRQENEQRKQAVAELLLQNRLLKQSVMGWESAWDD